MSQLATTLREAADQNSRLLTELAHTDYAPTSLQQNVAYIKDLESQIAQTDKELERLHKITEDERKVCRLTVGLRSRVLTTAGPLKV